MEPVLQEVDQKLTNALEHLKKELSAIRAGRANPSLVEELVVNAYGSRMKLMELGTIAAPQPSLLTIQVWDPSIIEDVRKAILEANLGINPAIDGGLIRLPIPPLTQDRREEFVKLAHQKGESARVEIRQIRMDQREDWQREKESGEMSEDGWHKNDKSLQELVDKATLQVDMLVEAKEQELMQV